MFLIGTKDPFHLHLGSTARARRATTRGILRAHGYDEIRGSFTLKSQAQDDSSGFLLPNDAARSDAVGCGFATLRRHFYCALSRSYACL